MLGGIDGMEQLLAGAPGTRGGAGRSGQSNGGESFDYDKMGKATAKAMEGMTVECDKREFGRIVREVQD